MACTPPDVCRFSYFSEMLTLGGLGGLVPTLKFGSEMESTLHYANSDDDPWRRSLHSIVFR